MADFDSFLAETKTHSHTTIQSWEEKKSSLVSSIDSRYQNDCSSAALPDKALEILKLFQAHAKECVEAMFRTCNASQQENIDQFERGIKQLETAVEKERKTTTSQIKDLKNNLQAVRHKVATRVKESSNQNKPTAASKDTGSNLTPGFTPGSGGLSFERVQNPGTQKKSAEENSRTAWIEPNPRDTTIGKDPPVPGTVRSGSSRPPRDRKVNPYNIFRVQNDGPRNPGPETPWPRPIDNIDSVHPGSMMKSLLEIGLYLGLELEKAFVDDESSTDWEDEDQDQQSGTIHASRDKSNASKSSLVDAKDNHRGTFQGTKNHRRAGLRTPQTPPSPEASRQHEPTELSDPPPTARIVDLPRQNTFTTPTRTVNSDASLVSVQKALSLLEKAHQRCSTDIASLIDNKQNGRGDDESSKLIDHCITMIEGYRDDLARAGQCLFEAQTGVYPSPSPSASSRRSQETQSSVFDSPLPGGSMASSMASSMFSEFAPKPSSAASSPKKKPFQPESLPVDGPTRALQDHVPPPSLDAQGSTVPKPEHRSHELDGIQESTVQESSVETPSDKKESTIGDISSAKGDSSEKDQSQGSQEGFGPESTIAGNNTTPSRKDENGYEDEDGQNAKNESLEHVHSSLSTSTLGLLQGTSRHVWRFLQDHYLSWLHLAVFFGQMARYSWRRYTKRSDAGPFPNPPHLEEFYRVLADMEFIRAVYMNIYVWYDQAALQKERNMWLDANGLARSLMLRGIATKCFSGDQGLEWQGISGIVGFAAWVLGITSLTGAVKASIGFVVNFVWSFPFVLPILFECYNWGSYILDLQHRYSMANR